MVDVDLLGLRNARLSLGSNACSELVSIKIGSVLNLVRLALLVLDDVPIFFFDLLVDVFIVFPIHICIRFFHFF